MTDVERVTLPDPILLPLLVGRHPRREPLPTVVRDAFRRGTMSAPQHVLQAVREHQARHPAACLNALGTLADDRLDLAAVALRRLATERQAVVRHGSDEGRQRDLDTLDRQRGYAAAELGRLRDALPVGPLRDLAEWQRRAVLDARRPLGSVTLERWADDWEASSWT